MKHFHTKSMILSAVILSALSIHTVGAATPETVNLDLGKTVRIKPSAWPWTTIPA